MFERSRWPIVMLLGLLSACKPADDQVIFWRATVAPASNTINHDLWQDTLDRFVVADTDGVNLVDYASLAADGMPRLDTYLQAMAATDPRAYPQDAQIAYWINVYNALTLQRVAMDWPTDSILKLGDGLRDNGPWDEPLISIQGRALSLNDIEHNGLRAVWQEPRIHFAVNCASIGCPDLSPNAYQAATLEAQLSAAAQDYLASTRGVRVEGDTLILSSIFEWYAQDFGGSSKAVTEYLATIAAPPTQDVLRRQYDNVRYDYDWSINAKR